MVNFILGISAGHVILGIAIVLGVIIFIAGFFSKDERHEGYDPHGDQSYDGPGG